MGTNAIHCGSSLLTFQRNVLPPFHSTMKMETAGSTENQITKHHNPEDTISDETDRIEQYFSTAGPRPGIGPWHQLYRAARGSPGVCHFTFLSSFHE